jgi:hypothetical protein
MDSIFFELALVDQGKFTALQREMLRMTMQANPGVMLGPAVTDVFDFLKEKIKPKRLEAICKRLMEEHQASQEVTSEPPAPGQQKSSFGEGLIKWINDLHSSDRLLAAVGFDVELARRIYCTEDYLVTDRVCTLYLQEKWQESVIQLEAAAAPWQGGKKGGGAGGPVEVFDMTQAGENDPQWNELAAALGG